MKWGLLSFHFLYEGISPVTCRSQAILYVKCHIRLRTLICCKLIQGKRFVKVRNNFFSFNILAKELFF